MCVQHAGRQCAGWQCVDQHSDASKHMGRRVHCTCRHASRQANRQVGKKVGRNAERQEGGHTGRKADTGGTV